MMSNLSILFNRIIDKNYPLRRTNKDWLLANGIEIKLRSPGNQSFGFSLDNTNKQPFCFMESKPPKGIAKMCDAIVVLSYKKKDYIFIIEKKTNNKDDYKLQLINGKHFCDWMISLLKEHEHYNQNPTYIGLLSWEPRGIPNREGTTHHDAKKSSKISPQLKPHFNKFEEIRNQTRVFLSNYLQ